MKILTFLFICLGTTLFSQELREIYSDVLTINSSSSLSGSTRNMAEVTLPEGTVSYVYRISVYNVGNATMTNKLINTVAAKGLGISSLHPGLMLSELALSSANSSSIDYFIFTDAQNANLFKNKSTNYPCKSFENRKNCCISSNECISNQNKIWFGFRNNNLTQGLDVRLEVLAVVDDRDYVYTIENEGWFDIKFSISTDGINWENHTLKGRATKEMTFKKKQLFFAMDRLRYTIEPKSYVIKHDISKNCNNLFVK